MLQNIEELFLKFQYHLIKNLYLLRQIPWANENNFEQ